MSVTRTYYCGSNGFVRRLDDFTFPWNTVSVPSSSVVLYDIKTDPSDPAKVFTVGTTNLIYTSSDSGATWVIPGGIYGSVFLQTAWYEIWPVDSDNIFVCGEGGFVAKSIDGGATFNNLSSLPTPSGTVEAGKTARALHFPTVSIGAVGFEDKVFTTVDGGDNWTYCNSGLPLVSTVPGYIFQINGIYTSPTGQTIIVHGNTDIFRSTDGGITFTSLYSYSSAQGQHLTWIDNTNFWASANYGEMVKSTNGGATWNLLRTSYPAFSIGYAAHFYTINNGFFSSSAEVYGTSDSGLTGLYSDTTPFIENFVRAIWTGLPNNCFQILNCGGRAYPIIVTDDLSSYVNHVVEIDDTCYFVLPAPNCIDSITLFPQGVPELPTYDDCISCNPPPCYLLHLCGDTGSPAEIIITSDDMSAYLGQVVRLCDVDAGVCYCYSVSEISPCTYGEPLPFPVAGVFPDCDCCLPPPEPEYEEPFSPSIPEINKHLYQITDSKCDIDANKVYANAMYTLFKQEQYGMTACCDINQNKIWIKKELSDLSLLKITQNVCS